MTTLLTRDVDLIRLAREIAIDHQDIDEVLDRYHLKYDDWRLLLEFPRFAALLANEEEAWLSAKNTKERVKYKAATLIEGYLEEAQISLHDRNQTLIARTGLAKLVAGFAGIGFEDGRNGSYGSSGGSNFSITINLGDQTLKVSKNDGFEGENRVLEVQNEEIPTLESTNAYENVHEINADLG